LLGGTAWIDDAPSLKPLFRTGRLLVLQELQPGLELAQGQVPGLEQQLQVLASRKELPEPQRLQGSKKPLACSNG
jgi:hypothetical protein